MPEYKEPYVSEVRELAGGYEEEDRGRISTNSSAMPTKDTSRPPSDTSEVQTGISDVSPEIIKAISEQIKKEIIQELGGLPTTKSDAATLQDSARGQPMEPSRSQQSTASTPSPPPLNEKVYTPPSPVQNTRFKPPTPPQASTSPTFRHSSIDTGNSMAGDKSGVRFRSTVGSESVKEASRSSRPALSGRTFSTAELTTIDQKWGTLFGADREPTGRLGQVLRGLANHLVEEFEPRKSLVVLPSKMAEFYSRFPLDKEEYDFQSVFQTEGTHQNLSRLYRDLHCEHHLVAAHPSQAPTVPSLTPNGFANWLTLFIVSHPDAEHKRLESIVLALPIDADGEFIDGKPERLPKQISRHLLPNKENATRQSQVSNAISDFMHETGLERPKFMERSLPRRASDKTTPVVTQPSKPMDIPKLSRPIERERQPYIATSTAGDFAVEDDGILAGGAKLERERQPYTAAPGSGKTYHTTGDVRQTTVNSSARPDRVTTNGTATTTSRTYQDSDDYISPATTSTRRESKAARDYVPPARTGAPYRSPSPGVIAQGPRRSVPTEVGKSASSSREDKYGTPFSSSTNFAPMTFSGSDRSIFAMSEVNSKPSPVAVESRQEKTRDSERDSHRDRGGDRERDRSGETNDSSGRRDGEKPRDRERERDAHRDESKTSGRTRRNTVTDRPAPLRASVITPSEEDLIAARERYERERERERERDREEEYSRQRGYDSYGRY